MNFSEISKKLGDFAKYLEKRYKARKSLETSTKEGLSFFHTDVDPKEMEASTPPDNEIIELHSVWVTEIYPPSKANSLKKSLKKLGWDVARETFEEESYSRWIENSRAGAYGGAWRHMGLIRRPGEESGLIESLNSRLPKGVSYASAIMRTVTPSLTLVTIQFAFDDSIAKLLGETLTRQYSTFVKPYKKRFGRIKRISYIQVPSQKREALAKQREEIYKECHRWVNRNIPGIFSDKSIAQSLPTVELLTTTKELPPSDPTRIKRDTYLDILIGRSAHIWESKDDQNIKLIFPGGIYKRSTPIFYGNKEELTKNLQAYGTDDRGKLVNFFGQSSSEIIGILAVEELLITYIKGLSNIRDNIVASRRWVGKIIKNIKNTRSKLLTIQSDSRIVGDDFLKVPQQKRASMWGASDFQATGLYAQFYGSDLVEYLTHNIEEDIDYIKTMGENVRDTVLTSNGLTNDETNLRIQRQVKWLTVIVVVISVITVVIAALTLYATLHPPKP